MVSMAISNSVAASGLDVEVLGRKGGRCRQRRTAMEESGENILLQRD